MNQTGDQNLNTALKSAKDVLILLPLQANSDSVAAGLGLMHALATEKNVTIGSSISLQVAQNLPGFDQITTKLGNRNLVISLKVDSRESIDKVSYNLDETGKVFNLVIQPKKGHPPLKSNDIDYAYSGIQTDLIIVVGANRLEDLGQIYKEEQKLFTDVTTIAIGRSNQAKFAQFHYASPEATSLSETVSDLLVSMDHNLSANSATCLLSGIDAATGNLTSPGVTAQTFETVAKLMRAGAQRQTATDANLTPQVSGQPSTTPTQNQVPQDWLSPKIYSGAAPSRQ
jgi:nanoRNase/pAp phosphatase (c-di-AMP/oligoRNAs hydrolase)